MRPSPARESDPALTDVAVQAAKEGSAAAAQAAEGDVGAAGALLESGIEEQVYMYVTVYHSSAL